MIANLGDMDDSGEAGTARSDESTSESTVSYGRAVVVPGVPRFQRNLGKSAEDARLPPQRALLHVKFHERGSGELPLARMTHETNRPARPNRALAALGSTGSIPSVSKAGWEGATRGAEAVAFLFRLR